MRRRSLSPISALLCLACLQSPLHAAEAFVFPSLPADRWEEAWRDYQTWMFKQTAVSTEERRQRWPAMLAPVVPYVEQPGLPFEAIETIEMSLLRSVPLDILAASPLGTALANRLARDVMDPAGPTPDRILRVLPDPRREGSPESREYIAAWQAAEPIWLAFWAGFTPARTAGDEVRVDMATRILHLCNATTVPVTQAERDIITWALQTVPIGGDDGFDFGLVQRIQRRTGVTVEAAAAEAARVLSDPDLVRQRPVWATETTAGDPAAQGRVVDALLATPIAEWRTEVLTAMRAVRFDAERGPQLVDRLVAEIVRADGDLGMCNSLIGICRPLPSCTLQQAETLLAALEPASERATVALRALIAVAPDEFLARHANRLHPAIVEMLNADRRAGGWGWLAALLPMRIPPPQEPLPAVTASHLGAMAWRLALQVGTGAPPDPKATDEIGTLWRWASPPAAVLADDGLRESFDLEQGAARWLRQPAWPLSRRVVQLAMKEDLKSARIRPVLAALVRSGAHAAALRDIADLPAWLDRLETVALVPKQSRWGPPWRQPVDGRFDLLQIAWARWLVLGDRERVLAAVERTREISPSTAALWDAGLELALRFDPSGPVVKRYRESLRDLEWDQAELAGWLLASRLGEPVQELQAAVLDRLLAHPDAPNLLVNALPPLLAQDPVLAERLRSIRLLAYGTDVEALECAVFLAARFAVASPR